ncbi:MAG: BMP family ABC transporter substrate-binding protein [Chloroflexota bacterium]
MVKVGSADLVTLTREDFLKTGAIAAGGLVLAAGMPGILAGGLAEAAAPRRKPLKKVKAAFVHVGPVGDFGWTHAHDLGRKYLIARVPGVETAYVENVPEGANAERVIRDFATKGYNIIFTTSFGYMDATLRVAKSFPDIVFEHCSGYKTAPNMATYYGKMEQAKFCCGVAAGMMTRSNVVGYVAPFPIPEVKRLADAFALGAMSVNPKVKALIVGTSAWYDPQKEKQAAQAMIAQGADVIAHGQDSPSANQTAQEHGKLSFGYDSDEARFAPKSVVTSALWNWGPYYERTVRDLMSGTWRTHEFIGDMHDGTIALAPLGAMVPARVRARVTSTAAAFRANTKWVFTGPIYDQSGKIQVPAGKVMAEKDILNIPFLVKGIPGSIG